MSALHDSTTPEAFLRAVMGGHHSLCSSAGGDFRLDGFFEDPHELLVKANALARSGREVWFGVHPLTKPPVHGRGGADDIDHVHVLQADLDWHDPVAHADPDLPSEEELRAAIRHLEHQPSYVVETGHGIHAYWQLQTSLQPEEGLAMTKRLHRMLENVGLKPERADLASMMRVPGTLNRKKGCEPVMARVVVARPDARYVPEFLDKRLPRIADGGRIQRTASSRSGGWRTLSEGHRSQLHPLTAAAVERLEQAGWHSPTIHWRPECAPHVGITRPGKSEGTQSATVGAVAPGVVHIFTSSAPGFLKDKNYTWSEDSGGWEELGWKAQSVVGAKDAIGVPCAPDGKPYTDVGNARRLLEERGEVIRYVPSWQNWFVYLDGRWQLDHADVLVSRWAGEIAQSMLKPEYMAALKNDADINRQIGWYKRTQSAVGISDAVRVARSMEEVYVHHEDFDARRELFNVKNGTIDLTSGECRPHRPEDLLCHMSRVEYCPTAEAPLWTAFLRRIIPDADVRLFLQRLFGMAMLGATEEHVLPIAVGNGANGKSTLTRIIASVFGDYAVVASRDLLMAVKRDTHPTTKATLFRRRLAHSGELNPDALLDEAQVKELTGGDRVKARRMRQDEWEFDPTHTFWLHANHLPRITGTDDGIWRRVLLVPFEVQVPAAEQDPRLADRILSSEASGVLNWLLEGLADYQRQGLAPPLSVQGATQQYRVESDTVEQFLEQLDVRMEPAAKTLASRLKDAHADWFGTFGISGEEGSHYRRVTQRLRNMGAQQRKGDGVRYWRGIQLGDRE